MAEYPVRGQKAPDYWDQMLKDYIDAVPAEQMADGDSDLARAVASSSASVAKPVEALPIYAAGHSGLIDKPTMTTGKKYIDQIKRRLGLGTLSNHGVNGYFAQDTAKVLAGTPTPVGPALFGLVLLDCVNDDNLLGGQAAKNLDGFTAGLDTCIWLAAASVRTADTTAAFAYAGTTSNLAHARLSSGAARSIAPGGTATITTPVGTDFGLIIYGNDSAVAAPATYTVTCDGVPSITNETYDFKQGLLPLTTGAVVIPFRGLASAAHTIVVTNTHVSATAYVDDLLTLSPMPPQIIVMGPTYCTEAGYDSVPGGASDASVDTYNQLAKGVITTWGDPAWITYVDLIEAGFNKDTMLGADGIHYNDEGAAWQADVVVAALAALPFRVGMNK